MVDGYVDIIRPHTVLEKGSMVGEHPLAFVIKEIAADVDDKDDILKIEAALKAILQGTDNLRQLETGLERYPV